MVRCAHLYNLSPHVVIKRIVLFTATLWAMLITWLASGRPKYPSMEGSIAYISDVGADILKPLFVAGCAVTGVSFFLSLSIERWLRHEGRCVSPSCLTDSGVRARLLDGEADSTPMTPQAYTHHAPARTRPVQPRDRRGVHWRMWAHPALDLRHEAAPQPPPRVFARVHSRGRAERYIYGLRGECAAPAF